MINLSMEKLHSCFTQCLMTLSFNLVQTMASGYCLQTQVLLFFKKIFPLVTVDFATFHFKILQLLFKRHQWETRYSSTLYKPYEK